MEFSIGSFKIVATEVKPVNNNLAERYLKKYASLQIGKTCKVFNLAINGVGRYYYSPQVNILAVYVLLEFNVARESFQLLTGLKEKLASRQVEEKAGS